MDEESERLEYVLDKTEEKLKKQMIVISLIAVLCFISFLGACAYGYYLEHNINTKVEACNKYYQDILDKTNPIKQVNYSNYIDMEEVINNAKR